jgi:hypothetical protein
VKVFPPDPSAGKRSKSGNKWENALNKHPVGADLRVRPNYQTPKTLRKTSQKRLRNPNFKLVEFDQFLHQASAIAFLFAP